MLSVAQWSLYKLLFFCIQFPHRSSTDLWTSVVLPSWRNHLLFFNCTFHFLIQFWIARWREKFAELCKVEDANRKKISRFWKISSHEIRHLTFFRWASGMRKGPTEFSYKYWKNKRHPFWKLSPSYLSQPLDRIMACWDFELELLNCWSSKNFMRENTFIYEVKEKVEIYLNSFLKYHLKFIKLKFLVLTDYWVLNGIGVCI